jgi:hypothetical protein
MMTSWCRITSAGGKGSPEPVNACDFVDKTAGKTIPYGLYDVRANSGWGSVGTDHDTAAFAVQTIRTWWHKAGQPAYPDATRLLICADGGGSNGYRTRLWQTELAALVGQTGLQITVCHFPPGTQCRCLTYRTIAGRSVSTLAATRRAGRRTWPALRKEYFEAGRLRNRSASANV